MGKSTISMAIFNSYVSLPEGICWEYGQPNRSEALLPFTTGQLLHNCRLSAWCLAVVANAERPRLAFQCPWNHIFREKETYRKTQPVVRMDEMGNHGVLRAYIAGILMNSHDVIMVSVPSFCTDSGAKSNSCVTWLPHLSLPLSMTR